MKHLLFYVLTLTLVSQDTLFITPDYIAKHDLKIKPQEYIFEIYQSGNQKPIGEFYERIETTDKLYHRFQKRTASGRTDYESTYFSLSSMAPISRTLISARGDQRTSYANDSVFFDLFKSGKTVRSSLKKDRDTFDSNYIDYVIAVMANQNIPLYSFKFYMPSQHKTITYVVHNLGLKEKVIDGKKIHAYHSQTTSYYRTLKFVSNYYVEKETGFLVLEEHINPKGITKMIRREVRE